MIWYLCGIINRKEILTMARPIKETPVLKGRDARRFAEKIANPVRISKEEREEAERIFEKFKKMSKLPM
jgi:hypothetical protein